MKAELLRVMGTDLDVVNNARVSFSKLSEWEMTCDHCNKTLSSASGLPIGNTCDLNWCTFKPTLKEGDKRLIGYLARGCTQGQWNETLNRGLDPFLTKGELDALLRSIMNMPTHWAPFANGVQATFRIKAPIPIMRQIFKHKVGTVESEVSRRYVDDEPEFFWPQWRKVGENIKQGSSDELMDDHEIDTGYAEVIRVASNLYYNMIERGVAPEQARFVLPQAMYTEAVITNSLYGWARFCIQRQDRSHAQREVADVADQVSAECSKLWPVSWQALVGTLD